MKLAIFTIKAGSASTDSDEDILEALMGLFEAFGCEVVGELTYEDIEDKDDGEEIG